MVWKEAKFGETYMKYRKRNLSKVRKVNKGQKYEMRR